MASNDFFLREATDNDLDSIMELEYRGFDPGNQENRDVYAQRIAAFPQGSLMAFSGENCIGCIFSEIWRENPDPEVEDFSLGHHIRDRHDPIHGTELYITSMTIDPTFRSKGFGQRLFDGCIARVKSHYPRIRSVLLLVNETWTHARTIYQASGFVEIARFKGFFHPVGNVLQDGIVMRKRL